MTKFLNGDGLTRLVALIKQALGAKQDALVSGTNIKTVNSNSLLGSGDIDVKEFYDIPSADITAIFAAVMGFPTQSAVNTACENLLTALQEGKTPRAEIVDGTDHDAYVIDQYGYTDDTVYMEYQSQSKARFKITGTKSSNDWTITSTSTNLQEQLESGTNIKTINNTSILGSGNISIQPNEIASISATESQVSGGNNVVTITETSGTTTTFNVKNGVDGQDGADGVSLGEIALVQTTGLNEDEVMSQKAVTLHTSRLTEEDLVSIYDIKVKLPSGYTMLDYIDNGTAGSGAIIDTGLTPTDKNWRLIGSWNRTGTPSANDAPIITTSSAGGTNTYRIARYSNTQTTILVRSWYPMSNSGVQITLQSSDANVWHTYDMKYGEIILDGTSYILGTSSTGYNNATSLLLGSTTYPQKIGAFKAYHNGEIVAQMIPCKHGTDIGMYDIIREQFYVSANANDFTAGNEVQQPYDRLLNGEGFANFFVQEKGDSDIKVMSQDAVTKYGERISGVAELAMKYGVNLRLPSGYTEVEWLGSDNGAGVLITDYVPQIKSVRFIGSFERTNSGSGSYPSIFQAYTENKNSYLIRFVAGNRTQLRFSCCSTGSTDVNLANTNDFVWHTFDMTYGKVILDGEEKTISTTSATGSSIVNTQSLRLFNTMVALRMGIFMVVDENGCQLCLIPCKDSNDVAGMYDTVSNTFYHESSNEVAYNAGPALTVPSADRLISVESFCNMIEHGSGSNYDKLMSQKAIAKEINYANYRYIKPTFFQGELCKFNLDDFPKLDPRSGDGLSIMLDGMMTTSSDLGSFVEIVGSDYTAGSGQYFSIGTYDYGCQISAGICTNYYQNVVASTGCKVSATNSNKRFAHFVATFSFKTGELCVYRNGVLQGSNTPATYEEQLLRTYFANHNILRMGHSRIGRAFKFTGMALFPRVLSASEVADLYGVGCESTKGDLVPPKWEANLMHSISYTGSDIGIYKGSGTLTTDGNKRVLTLSSGTYLTFGFTGISGVINNLIYEWDLEIISDTWTLNHSSGGNFINLANYYKNVTIYDENGTDVTTSNLTEGNTYHVVCMPDNISANKINAESNYLCYRFNRASSEGSSQIGISNLKVLERGCALVCNIHNFRGDMFEQKNGDRVPRDYNGFYYNSPMKEYYGVFKDDVVKYDSSAYPLFTGQYAIDFTNNKVYIGYITGAGTGTWKQVNNS